MNGIDNDYEYAVEKIYERLTKNLIEKNITITAMESATGGFIASLITDNEGSSGIFKGSFVTYSNDSKIKAGVKAEIIDKYSVYSEETAKAMANAARSYYKTDVGIGVTGTFGNVDPSNKDFSEPGKVYIAIDFKGNTEAYTIIIENVPQRHECKYLIAEKVGVLLLSKIITKP